MDLHALAQSIGRAVQRLSELLPDWKQHAILYSLFALAVGFVVGRYLAGRAYRSPAFQNRGEALLSRVALKNFGFPDYHLMNHVTLQMNDGTTQVDHILVSRYGVFVVETKDYKGWIFADAKQSYWTQVLFNAKFKFQNPILQNFRHVCAVKDILDFLPPGAVKSAVVFTGEAEFKTEVPQGVFTLSGFMDYVHEQTDEVMSLNRVQFCVGRLETVRLAVSGKTDVEHVESLERRHGNVA